MTVSPSVPPGANPAFPDVERPSARSTRPRVSMCAPLVRRWDGGSEMQYPLMIVEDPAERARLSDAEQARISPDYGAFTAALVQAGNFRAGDALAPVTTATTIRVRGGKRLVTDGPFAETKEHLIG